MGDTRDFLRGQIYYCDLSPVVDCEQGGIRPVLIVQGNFGNKHSHTTVVCAITSQVNKAVLPTHIKINAKDIDKLKKDSVIMTEQIRTISKNRLRDYVGIVDDVTMMKVENAIQIGLGMFS